jgi:hypothetical protein
MAIFENNRSSLLGLAALMVMAIVISSCHANKGIVDHKSYLFSPKSYYVNLHHFLEILNLSGHMFVGTSCSVFYRILPLSIIIYMGVNTKYEDGGDACARTLIGCNRPLCSKLCNYVDGAHCTNISKCSCSVMPVVAPSNASRETTMKN